MENSGSLIPNNKFQYIQINFPIDSDEAVPFMIRAVEMADDQKKIVHIQSPNGITIHIIHPEDITTN